MFLELRSRRLFRLNKMAGYESYNKAKRLYRVGRLKEARKNFEDFLETHPNHVAVNAYMAKILRRQRKPADAIK